MLSNFKQICTKLNIQRMHMEKETAYAYGKKWYHPASCWHCCKPCKQKKQFELFLHCNQHKSEHQIQNVHPPKAQGKVERRNATCWSSLCEQTAGCWGKVRWPYRRSHVSPSTGLQAESPHGPTLPIAKTESRSSEINSTVQPAQRTFDGIIHETAQDQHTRRKIKHEPASRTTICTSSSESTRSTHTSH